MSGISTSTYSVLLAVKIPDLSLQISAVLQPLGQTPKYFLGSPDFSYLSRLPDMNWCLICLRRLSICACERIESVEYLGLPFIPIDFSVVNGTAGQEISDKRGTCPSRI